MIGWSPSARRSRAAIVRVMQRQRQGPAHQAGRADGEVEPRQMRISISRMPLPSSPSSRPGVVILDLAGGVGLVAALVLEPLDEEAVVAPVGQHARHEEAARPFRCARVKKPSLIGAEQNHLWPVSRYPAPGPRTSRSAPSSWSGADPSRPASRSSPCRSSRRSFRRGAAGAYRSPREDLLLPGATSGASRGRDGRVGHAGGQPTPFSIWFQM